MPGPFQLTVAGEKTLISGYIHSAILSTLLLGIYTAIYFGTMYIYSGTILSPLPLLVLTDITYEPTVTGKSSKHQFVLAAITVLYLVNVVYGLMQWVEINVLIGTRGKSRKGDLFAEFGSFSNNSVLEDITQYVPFFVADGLLIWRCYKVWNDSLRTITPSLILFLGEIVLYLTVMVLDILPSTFQAGTAHNHLITAGLLTTLVGTIWTTALIAYRIYSASRHLLHGEKPRFHNILEIIIQSSFTYSAALVANALIVAMPINQSNVFRLFTAGNYVGVILHAITAIAPTVMVARVALASDLTLGTEPTAIETSAVIFEEKIPKINTGETMGYTTVSQGRARST